MARARQAPEDKGRLENFGETVHRAFVEFLRLPVLIKAWVARNPRQGLGRSVRDRTGR